MPLFTTLAALSQTAASNPPDGAVDAPSTIDDQLRLLGSFVAQLRDGAGFTVTALMPPGSMLDFGGAVPPAGFLLCDGTAVSRTTYAPLFAAIGTAWGGGDGLTTFNLPDIRGRASIGAGNGIGLTARTLGTVFGEEAHVLTTAELAAHNHGVTDPTHQHGVSITSGVNSADHTHSGTTLAAGGHSHSLLGGIIARLLTPFVTGGGNFGPGPASTADIANTDAVADHQHTFTTGGISASHSHLVSGNTALVGTGITVNNNGSGSAHNNMQPSAVVTKIIKI